VEVHLTSRQIAELRLEFTKGGLEASLVAAQLLEIVEKMQAQLDLAETLAGEARRELAQAEAAALAAHLAEAAAQGVECASCHNAEARAVVSRLVRIAEGGDGRPPAPAPERGARRRGAGCRS
jgi:cytochrome c553